MGFPRQEYWSGLSLPSLGDLPDPGTEPMSSVDSLLLSHQEIPYGTYTEYVYVYVRNAHIRNLEKWF